MGEAGAMTTVNIPDGSLFGINNLPYGVFSPEGRAPRVGVRVGNSVIDLAVALKDPVFAESTVNAFMAQGHRRWLAVRERIYELVTGDIPTDAIFPLESVQLAPADDRDGLCQALCVGEPRRRPRPALPARIRSIDLQLEACAGEKLPRSVEYRQLPRRATSTRSAVSSARNPRVEESLISDRRAVSTSKGSWLCRRNTLEDSLPSHLIVLRPRLWRRCM